MILEVFFICKYGQKPAWTIFSQISQTDSSVDELWSHENFFLSWIFVWILLKPCMYFWKLLKNLFDHSKSEHWSETFLWKTYCSQFLWQCWSADERIVNLQQCSITETTVTINQLLLMLAGQAWRVSFNSLGVFDLVMEHVETSKRHVSFDLWVYQVSLVNWN